MTQYNKIDRNEMTKIKEAAEVSLSIYNSIDSYRLPEVNRVAHKSLGQVLRSLVELLDNERNKYLSSQVHLLQSETYPTAPRIIPFYTEPFCVCKATPLHTSEFISLYTFRDSMLHAAKSQHISFTKSAQWPCKTTKNRRPCRVRCACGRPE